MEHAGGSSNVCSPARCAASELDGVDRLLESKPGERSDADDEERE
jgi:hypothetical protein